MTYRRKTVGLDRLQKRLATWTDSDVFVVRVQSRATTGRRYSAERKAWTEDSHSAARNAIKIRWQAKHGRNWLFISDATRKRAEKTWAKGFKAFTERQDIKALERAAYKIGEILVAEYQKHMREGRSKRGPVKDIKWGTKLSKIRELNLAPLATGGTRKERAITNKARREAAMDRLPAPGVRTGQAIASFEVKVRRTTRA